VPLFPDEPTDARRLRLIRIDSEADIGVVGRVAARGDFRSHLAYLRDELSEYDEDEIRVLLVHHTRLATGTYFEKIRRACRKDLDRFIAERDIAVILTGHIHEPLWRWSQADDGAGRAWPWLEICAGTATQRDTPPESWKLKAKEELARFRSNTLCVHRLYKDDGVITWEAAFELRGSTGFRPTRDPDPRPIKVWPRPAAPIR
jgi:hypothetical protein